MTSTYRDTDRSALRAETTGSMAEAVGGIAIIVLSIIALSRIGFMGALPGIAVIILGAALLAEGGTVASEFSRLVTAHSGSATGANAFGGGMTIEIIVGAVVLVLGVLSLLGITPAVLLPTAVIVAGALLPVTAANAQRMNAARIASIGSTESTHTLMQTATPGVAGHQVLAATAAIVLGILSLVSPAHGAVFTLVGLLVLGVAVAMSGSTVTGSLMRMAGR